MRSVAVDRTESEADRPSPTKRRSLLLGAGAAGAAVIAAKTVPMAPQAVSEAVVPPASETSAGYQLTQHVLRYYETTKV